MNATATISMQQLTAGDHIVAMDGNPVDIVVEGTRRADGALRMVNPRGVTEWWLYPDLAETWTVDRPEPPRMHLDLDFDDRDALLGAARRVVELVPRIRVRISDVDWSVVPLGDPITDPKVGDVVMFLAFDYYRPGVVTRVGRKRLRIAYTTPHGNLHRQGAMIRNQPRELCYPVAAR